MVRLLSTTVFLVTMALAVQVDGHPGEHHHEDAKLLAARRLYAMNAKLSYQACQGADHVRQLQENLAQRRLTKINELRSEVQRRRLTAAEVLAKNHKSTSVSVSVTTVSTVSATVLFGGTPQCVLQPEVTHGPYYVKGELIREDITETQPGITLYTEIQVINTKTCKPMSEYYVEFWHCNTTGVYSGVVANTNGNSNDKTNWDTTFARGLFPTDSDGIVQFKTKFPGHYTGRATHVHVMGQNDGTVLTNKTYVGGRVSSIGQIFFDQSLINAVEATTEYAKNKQPITTNANDNIFKESAATFDPVVNYVYLGNSVEDGIFSWISIGVDPTTTKTVQAAATLTATGGVASSSVSTTTGKSPAPAIPTVSTFVQLTVAAVAILAPALF